MLLLGAGGLLLDSARATDTPAKQSVLVGIGSVLPQIPDFTDVSKPMTFSGRMQNTRSTAVKVLAELRRSSVDVRSALGSATGNGTLVQSKTAPKYQELAPGATVDWKFTPTETELFGTKTPRPGVYAIDVDVFDPDGGFLGGQRTFVVWKPLSLGKKAQVALLWPVVGTPGLTGKRTPNNAAAPILPDAGAAQQFQPGGRLDQILQYGKQFPVNWVLDPDVLYTADQLAGGYFVAAAGGDKTPGNQAGDAKAWYDAAHELFTSLNTQNCWNLPYADPDLATLSRTGPGRALLDLALKLQAPAITGGCRGTQTLAWLAAARRTPRR